ncbi:hypothetical protein N300_02192, partial [Calypte anna]
IPDSEEEKGDNFYNNVREDPPPYSLTTIPESMDGSQEGSEDSCSNSATSQHGADREDGSSSHHGAEEYIQEMDLGNPALEDKHIDDIVFPSNMRGSPGFLSRQTPITSSNSSMSLRFPLNNNLGETGNSKEDCEIYMFVK